MTRRPLAVSAVCVLGALAAVYTAALFLTTRLWAVQPTLAERSVALAVVAVALLALSGMWRMRRWGVFLLGAALAVRLGYGVVSAQPWRWAPLAGPAIVLVIGLAYVRRMT